MLQIFQPDFIHLPGTGKEAIYQSKQQITEKETSTS
jgi:hypothetical protein